MIQFIADWRSGNNSPAYVVGDRASFSVAREAYLVAIKRVAVYCPLSSGAPVPAPVVVVTDATHDVSSDEAGSYLRFIAAGAKTCTWRPHSEHAIPSGSEHHIANRSASGDVTLTAGSGVTLNPASGGTLVLEPGMTATVKQAGIDVYDVIGQTTAA